MPVVRFVLRSSVLLALVLFNSAGGTDAEAREESGHDLPGAQIVLLLDESGSLQDGDIAAAKEAAKLLVHSELSAQSTVSVVGFGSANALGQTAAVAYCQAMPLDSAPQLQLASECIDLVHRRTSSEGFDTDHAAALRAAAEIARQSSDSDPVIVFLLTDGLLDVSNSLAYGHTSDSRHKEASRLIEEEILPGLEKADIQVWPIGFGSARLDSLETFAEGGKQEIPGCETSSKPRARLAGIDDISQSFVEALAGARCLELHYAQGSEVAFEVSPLTTSGALVVRKGTPEVEVAFIDPNGDVVVNLNGSTNGSSFSHSGAGTRIERLRIYQPLPGSWTVRTSGDGSSSSEVFAVWTGEIRASISLSPSIPKAGDEVDVSVRLATTQVGRLESSPTFEDVSVSLVAEGDNFGPIRSPALHSESGVFKGQIAIPPRASGPGLIEARVDSSGLQSDNRPTFFVIGEDRASVALSATRSDRRLTAGEVLEWQIDSQVESDALPVSLYVTLDSGNSASRLSLSPRQLTLPSDVAQTSFQMRIGEDASPGFIAGAVSVEDEVTGAELARELFEFEVVEPPSLLTRLLPWLLALTLVTAVVGAALAVLRRARKPRSVGGLVVQWRRDQEEDFEHDLVVPRSFKGTSLGLRLADARRDEEQATLQICAPTAPETMAVVSTTKSQPPLQVVDGDADPRALRFGEWVEIGAINFRIMSEPFEPPPSAGHEPSGAAAITPTDSSTINPWT